MLDFSQIPLIKLFHVSSIIVFITLSSIILWYGGRSKSLNITIGVSTLVILLTGAALMSAHGWSLWTTWPLWVKVKILIWLLLGMMIPIISRRFPKLGKIGYVLMIGLVIFAYKMVLDTH